MSQFNPPFRRESEEPVPHALYRAIHNADCSQKHLVALESAANDVVHHYGRLWDAVRDLIDGVHQNLNDKEWAELVSLRLEAGVTDDGPRDMARRLSRLICAFSDTKTGPNAATPNRYAYDHLAKGSHP